jgi:N-acetylmuramoyl-L-alanine amidase
MKPMPRQITHLVIHCTATPQTTTVASIQRYWRDNLKWKSPGYHRIIQPNGVAIKLAEDATVCNGVAGHNKTSIHISYIGGVDKDNKPLDNRTPQQVYSMVALIKQYKEWYPGLVICGHRDFAGVKKACPSFDVAAWLKTLNL